MQLPSILRSSQQRAWKRLVWSSKAGLSHGQVGAGSRESINNFPDLSFSAIEPTSCPKVFYPGYTKGSDEETGLAEVRCQFGEPVSRPGSGHGGGGVSIWHREVFFGADASKGLKKNVKLTDPFLGNLADPLSESEGEVPEEEDGSVFAPISSDPVAAALGKLTEIAGVLAEDQKKKPSVSKLEAALDSAYGGHSEVAVGSGKRFAAAWRAFRVILRDAPGDVSALIEK